jgi:hypothetical protein
MYKKGKTMKVSTMLFSLLVACQALPAGMQTAAAQSGAEVQAAIEDARKTFVADQFGPERIRNDYTVAVARLKLLAGKPLAYTYDLVLDMNMTLAGWNAIKTHTTTSFAFDKAGRSRSVSSMSGLERIIIADPTTQTAYLICPERKEVLRMTGAALAAPPGTAPAWQVSDETKAATNTDLGEKMIAGVKAKGTRMETIIPAGAKGNDKPLVHTSEGWYAPDLATLVYSRTSMPEFGDTFMHVENLKFGDVPASTFALPDGYAIRDIALPGTK